ncbi:DUF6461 domain-containing protein [Streptomyces sp. NPDC051183]|uniref:DUF6461 domain-containing protein n=1 Tax=unclassified Streptomyces TaxID=2593676 RepID=UPI003437C79E
MTVDLFPNSNLYETGYCVIFAKGISAKELLARAGKEDIHPIGINRMEAEAIKALGEEIDEDIVPELSIEELHDAGILVDDGPLLRAGTLGDWSFVVESEGAFLAGEGILARVSVGSVALAAQLSDSMAAWISYAENGEVLSSFDPLFPEQDYGTRPERLESLTGYREAIGGGDRSIAFESAFRKIQRELHCDIPKEVDEQRLLTIRIPGGY